MSQTRPEYVLKIDAQLAVQDHFNNNGFAGYRDAQKMLDRITAIPAADVMTNIFPKKCRFCVGCELEADPEDGCPQFILSPSRARMYIER